MARTKISEFSATAADNTDINNINIAEGCAPSGINNAIREMMKQLKDFQAGTSGDPFTTTNLSYTGTLTGGTGVVNLGSGQFYKDASGNVLFGATDIVNTDFGAKFIKDSTTSTILAVHRQSNNGDVARFARGGNDVGSISVTTTATSYNTSSSSGLTGVDGNTIAFTTNSSEAMRITAAGNVGIGESSPSATLHIADSSGGGGGRIRMSCVVSSGYDSRIFQDDTGLNFSAVSNSRSLVFRTGNSDVERARIDGSGNFGIGITSPTQKLHVGGNILSTGSIDCGTQFLGLAADSASAPSFSFSGDTNTGMYRPGSTSVGFAVNGSEILRCAGTQVRPFQPMQGINGSAAAPAYSFNGDQNTGMYRAGANNLAFATNGSEQMRINNLGLVFINRTVDVSGFGSYLNITHSGGNVYGIMLQNNVTAQSNALSFINSSNNMVGSIAVTTTNTTYVTSSDYRLKENVEPMTGALEKVQALNPVTWSWKTDGAPGQGFIAHELQAVCPDAVTGKKDAVKTVEVKDDEGNVIGTEQIPEYQGVDTSFLVGILTKAIQELNAKVDAQAAEIAALKA